MGELLKIVATGAVSALVAYFVNAFSFSSKTKEIKLTNYHKDRIDAVKMLYSLIIDLENSNEVLFKSEVSDLGHDGYKLMLKDWEVAYRGLNYYYRKNRILLVEENELSNSVRANLNNLSPVLHVVRDERKELDELELQYGSSGLSYYYKTHEDEYADILKSINKLRSNKITTNIDGSFKLLTESLEIYFRSLVN